MEDVKIIAVDFDGTLCRNCYPDIGEPNLKLIAILKNLRRKGCRVILWTCRCGKLLEEAVQWCRQFQLTFDAVNENAEETLLKYGTDSRKYMQMFTLMTEAVSPGKFRKKQEKI